MQTFEVKILGQRYKVRSDEKEEYVQGLAKYLTEQLDEVQKNTKTVATHNLAILAALNITDTLFKLREDDTNMKKEVREKVRRILKLIRAGSGE
ncbi:MAG: cell division protein ZapA [Deltaproteobacteria bacterium]|nr:cell division protein ZapA [Deltaproteobacteria bacterium]